MLEFSSLCNTNINTQEYDTDCKTMVETYLKCTNNAREVQGIS